jgi:endonuclease YncB( thermonuclease family)
LDKGQHTMKHVIAGISLIGLVVLSAGANAQPVNLKPPPNPDVITGQPQFVPGRVGLFGLNGTRIVLHGVDPVLPRMLCIADRGPWDCNSAGVRLQANLIGREPMTCEPRGVDVFGRTFAKCEVHGQDIATFLIDEGMAVAIPEETPDYVEAEKAAKAKKAGFWRGQFMTPAEHRAMQSGEPIPR